MLNRTLESQLGGRNGDEIAHIVREGWVGKESKWFSAWRSRWLVLFFDRQTKLPHLCTFKSSRTEWDAETPPATERILLVGALCLAASGSTQDYGRSNVFHLQARTGNFFFSAPSESESFAWVRAISQSIAEATLRLGGSLGLVSIASPTTSNSEASSLTADVAPGGAAAGTVAAPSAAVSSLPSDGASAASGRSAGKRSVSWAMPAGAPTRPSAALTASPSGSGSPPLMARKRSRPATLHGHGDSAEGSTSAETSLPAGDSSASAPLSFAPAAAALASVESPALKLESAAAVLRSSEEVLHSSALLQELAEKIMISTDGAGVVEALRTAMARGEAVDGDSTSAASGGEEAGSSKRETELSEENLLLISQINALRSTLEQVAVAELVAELENLEVREVEMLEELHGTRQAALKAVDFAELDAAEALVRRSIGTALRDAGDERPDEGAVPEDGATAEGDAALPLLAVDGRQASSQQREWEKEISVLEHELATLQLRRHIVRDSLHQLDAQAEGEERDDDSNSDGRQSPGTRRADEDAEEEDGYVPFLG